MTSTPQAPCIFINACVFHTSVYDKAIFKKIKCLMYILDSGNVFTHNRKLQKCFPVCKKNLWKFGISYHHLSMILENGLFKWNYYTLSLEWFYKDKELEISDLTRNNNKQKHIFENLGEIQPKALQENYLKFLIFFIFLNCFIGLYKNVSMKIL